VNNYEPVDCEETKVRVHEYLHQELQEPQMEAITAHLANCENCEREYDIEVVFNQVIQHSCDEAPPPELAKRVLDRLREIQDHE
jgi:anti-sigma factor (TIGR02949 family)